MPTITPGQKVLVTGANGFIAVWVVKTFLEKGYSVRGTVRSESKAQHIKKLFESYGDKFEVVIVPDITAPGAFDAAVEGVDAVAHTASPFHLAADDPKDMLDPAVKGTTGVLESVHKDGNSKVKRVVILASSTCIANLTDTGVLDENVWNESSVKEIQEKGREAAQTDKYCAAKTLAEKAAWEFVEKHKSELKWDIVTIQPPYVFGPLLHEISSPDTLNTSMKFWWDAVIGHLFPPEMALNGSQSWIDVRDVAIAHVRALEIEEAGGKRFPFTAGTFLWQDLYDASNAAESGIAPVGTPGAGKTYKHNQIFVTKQAEEVLGMKWTDLNTTCKDIINDFKTKKWIPVAKA